MPSWVGMVEHRCEASSVLSATTALTDDDGIESTLVMLGRRRHGRRGTQRVATRVDGSDLVVDISRTHPANALTPRAEGLARVEAEGEGANGAGEDVGFSVYLGHHP
jgi:hypothetical protein